MYITSLHALYCNLYCFFLYIIFQIQLETVNIKISEVFYFILEPQYNFIHQFTVNSVKYIFIVHEL